MIKRISNIHIVLSWLAVFTLPFLNAQSKPIPNQVSNINFGLEIPLDAIEDAINKGLPKLLVEDNSYVDNDVDDTKTWVTKAGSVKIKAYNSSVMQVAIPLEVKVDKRFGAMGVYNSQVFDFQMTMYCLVSGEIAYNGEMVTKTQIQKYEFQKRPVLNIAGVSIPISTIVESELNENKATYAKAIDDNIRSKIPLKEVFIDLLQYFSTPFKANDEYNAWIDYNCKSIEYTPFEIVGGKMKTRVNLVSQLQIYMAETPIEKPPIQYVPYVQTQYLLPEISEINSFISIPYEMAEKQAKDNFVGKNYKIQNEKYEISVDDFQLSGSPEQLQMEIETSGDFQGTIALSGTPSFDNESKKVFLADPLFRAKSKNLLYSTALWIKKSSIQKSIAQEYGLPIAENIDIIKTGIDGYLNTSYYNSVYLKGKTLDLDIKEISTSQYGILIFYQLKYQLDIEIKELKSF